MGIWRTLGEGLMGALYPEDLYCMACGDIGDFKNSWGLCPKCLSSLLSEENLRGTLMKETIGHSYSRVLACTVYGDVSKEIIGKFKNKSQPWLGKYLGDLMAQRYLEEERTVGPLLADVVTYVPIHSDKQKVRGYDQAQLLAEQMGQSLGFPCVSCLERVRQTAAMKNMSQEQRRQNVEGAFRWNENGNVRGKHVILVDDVITTGSTAEACAFILRNQGAREVTVVAFAAAAHQSAKGKAQN